MTKEEKLEIIREFGADENDVGGTEVQIAVLSRRITDLTNHLKEHRDDQSSRRGLIAMVNRRRKLLKYLNRKDHHRYVSIIRRLKLRR